MKADDATHERLVADQRDQAGSERGFGVVFAVFCAIVSAALAWHDKPAYLWWLVAAATFGVLAFAVPALLRPLNLVWFKFGLLLHHVVSPVVLGLMFYCAFVPIGMLMRVMDKRPLNLRFDRNAESYWIHRRPPPGRPRIHSITSSEIPMSLLRELWTYMKVRKKFWLIPIIVMMVVFGGLVVLTKGSAVAPFIYTIF